MPKTHVDWNVPCEGKELFHSQDRIHIATSWNFLGEAEQCNNCISTKVDILRLHTVSDCQTIVSQFAII